MDRTGFASPGFVLALAVTLAAQSLIPFASVPFPWPLAGLWAAFVWAWRRPSVEAVLAVAVLGVFQDVASGGPIGVWAAVFPLGYLMAIDRLTLVKSLFTVVLAGPALVAAIGVGLAAAGLKVLRPAPLDRSKLSAIGTAFAGAYLETLSRLRAGFNAGMMRLEVGFAAYVIAAAFAGWALASYAAQTPLPIGRLGLITAVTIALFPVVRPIFARREVFVEKEREP